MTDRGRVLLTKILSQSQTGGLPLTTDHDLSVWIDGEIKAVQNGSGLARENFPEGMKGRVARDLWNDTTFSYGMEYGYLLALVELKRKIGPAEEVP
jgi:hypothetical protein